MRSIGRDEKPRLVFQDRSLNCVPFNCVPLPPRSGFSYNKLPPSLLKLSVLKLDGSSFDVHISSNASVAELKQAVENVFFESGEDREGDISWSHVWGHFCLCHDGRKLVNNKACIRSFGIKDGDQLHFVQHLSVSVNSSPMKRQSKSLSAFCEQQTLLVLRSDVWKESKKKMKIDDNIDDPKENERSRHFDEAFDGDLIGHPQFKLAHLVKGWFPYSKLRQTRRTISERKVHPWRLTGL